MLRLDWRRLVALPIMALGVTVLVFCLMSFSKTDFPAYTALGDGASPEAVAEYHEKYGLNDPLARAVRALYGRSDPWRHGHLWCCSQPPLPKRIATALPVTMQLTFIGLAIGAVVSFLLRRHCGTVSRQMAGSADPRVLYRRHRNPVVLVRRPVDPAVLFLYGCAPGIRVLCLTSPRTPVGYLGRMIMPAIALAFPLTGQMTRIVRTAMVEELDKDYVRIARGAGVPEKVVVASTFFAMR